MLYLPNTVAIPAVDRELNKVRQTFNELEPEYLILRQWNAAPARPQDGMIVYADGVNWNPGAGNGVYVYRGGAWNLLG